MKIPTLSLLERLWKVEMTLVWSNFSYKTFVPRRFSFPALPVQKKAINFSYEGNDGIDEEKWSNLLK